MRVFVVSVLTYLALAMGNVAAAGPRDIELPPTVLDAKLLCYRGQAGWCMKEENAHVRPAVVYVGVWVFLMWMLSRDKGVKRYRPTLRPHSIPRSSNG